MVPESVLAKTERPSFFMLLSFSLVTGIHHLIYQLLSRSWISWSWASLMLGPPNVEPVHMPTWPDVGASWWCSLFSAPGRTRARLLLSQLPGPSTPARNLWKFPELASYAKHLCSWAGNPQAAFQAYRANSHSERELPFSIFSHLLIFLHVQGWPVVLERNRFC